MLIDIIRYVAFICPFCSKISIHIISPFDFSGNRKVSLNCDSDGCFDRPVTISLKNKKFKINVDCPVCSSVHTFTINEEAFWAKDLAEFKCSESGIAVLITGSKEAVETDIINKSSEYEQFVDSYDSDMEFDILTEIFDCLNALKSLGKLKCECGNEDIVIIPGADNITVTCNHCGKTRSVHPTEDTLIKLLNSKMFILK